MDFLRGIIPSTENLVIAFWNEIEARLASVKLHRVRLYETPRNFAEYEGPVGGAGNPSVNKPAGRRKTPPLVMVTGASQGIGAEIALAFAREAGARLALVARQAGKLRAEARRSLNAGAAAAECFACDCTDSAAIDAMAEAVRERLGEPDVVVANAGHFSPVALLEMDAAAFDAEIGANLRSAFLTARAFAPAMAERGRGDLFFMASWASVRAFPRGGAYVAAKHGVLGLARAFREELRSRGVRVAAVMPGATVSPSWDGSGGAGGENDAGGGRGAHLRGHLAHVAGNDGGGNHRAAPARRRVNRAR